MAQAHEMDFEAPKTVGELIEILLLCDKNLPVVLSCLTVEDDFVSKVMSLDVTVEAVILTALR